MVSMVAIFSFAASFKKSWKEFLVDFTLLAFLYAFSYVFFLKIKIVFVSTAKLTSSLPLTIDKGHLWEGGKVGAILLPTSDSSLLVRKPLTVLGASERKDGWILGPFQIFVYAQFSFLPKQVRAAVACGIICLSVMIPM